MQKKYDVIIIGAGTAGLSARKEVAKKTDNYIVIDGGTLGTTCARVGCMPSKVLIQVANDFSRRKTYSSVGIHGAENLSINPSEVMHHVRSLRDRFVSSVLSPMEGWQDKFVEGYARFIDEHTVAVGDQYFSANKIIIAAGSRPVIPGPWQEYKDHLIDTNSFFEMPELPKKMAVIGLGVIGIELGQALSRIGVDVIAMTMGKQIGGLTDPTIQDYVVDKFAKEFHLHINGAQIEGLNDQGQLRVKADDKIYEVDKALISVGRRANIDKLKIESLGLTLNKRGLPAFNTSTMAIEGHPHLFIAGDINGDRPILHEAADEGVIAGYNAVNEEQCFKRRVNLGITFSDPNIAFVGQRYQDLIDSQASFVTGQVSFEGQGRSIVKLKEQGLLHLYAHKESGEILGAEIHAPDGEHLAHLLAWAMSMKLSVQEALRMPFYHPVIEEGLRTALRNAAEQIGDDVQKELFRCSDPPIR